MQRHVTHSLQSIAQNTSTDSAKNKCKNTQPVKYVKSVSELKVLMPKTKECVSLKQSLEISCDICDIKFPSFAHLGEHIMKNHKRSQDFSCSLCDGKFSTKMDLDNHFTNMHCSQKVEKVKNGKKGNKK